MMAQKVFFNRDRQTVLGDRIDVANTSTSRNRGLLKHTGLDDGEGLWIVPCEAVHTFWMRFAIDCVFIDKKQRVTKVVQALRPWRMAMSWKARGVLELPAGQAAKTGTVAGDEIEIRDAA